MLLIPICSGIWKIIESIDHTNNINLDFQLSMRTKGALFHKKIQTGAFNSKTIGMFINDAFDNCTEKRLSNCDNVRFHKTNDISNLFLAKGFIDVFTALFAILKPH